MNQSARPRHCQLDYFPTRGNQLLVGNLPLEELAKKVGSTPFYAYDHALIERRIQQLRELLPQQIRLHYAIKANPMPALVQYLASQVDGFDVASQGEMHSALASTVPARHISFTGPGKDDQELAQAITAGVTINLESEGEMERLARLADVQGVRPRVTVRVNPDFELKSSGLRMSGGAKQFGVDAERVPAMLRRLGTLDLEFVGLHIFSGSQSLNAAAIIEAQNETLKLAVQLAEYTPAPLQILNIGGGFGIPYFPGDEPLQLHPIADNLRQLCSAVKQQLGDTEVILELGRFLVGEAGIYVCRILDRKLSHGQVFLITDGGMHQHLAASGNLGQIVRKNYPVVIGNKMKPLEKEWVTIVGRLCTPLDILADKVELPKAEIGDLVVILQSGAYGLTASPSAFLGHPAPQEVLV